MKYTQIQIIEILKFLAQHPFEEIYFGEEGFSQIIKINYASKEVTLRDYCEYSVEDIINTNGFKDELINSKWIEFLKNLQE